MFFASLEESRSEADLPALVATYSPLLFRVAYSVLRDRAEAEDAVQDTFVRVLQHAKKLNAVDDKRAWLVRITWNLALDRKRKVQPEPLDEAFAQKLASEYAPADQVMHEARRMQDVLHEIEKLPKAEKQVLLLAAMDELNTAEIAAVVERSEAAVRGLLFRARTRLRERLERRH